MQLLLLEHGAAVDCIEDLGDTPLHLASGVGRLKAVQQLVEFGADVNKHRTNSVLFDLAPLHHAVLSGNVEIVCFPLKHGADVNDRDCDGRTALHFAMDRFEESFEITLALLEWGADVRAEDNSNMTPLDLALNNGHNDIVQLLLLRYGEN